MKRSKHNLKSPDEIDLEYIRDTYHVPAYIGQEIIEWEGREGNITGAYQGHLLVSFVEGPYSGTYHPTWEICYVSPVHMCFMSEKNLERIKLNLEMRERASDILEYGLEPEKVLEAAQ